MYDTRTLAAPPARSTPPSGSSLRGRPVELLGRVSLIRQKALPLRSEAEIALLEAFDLARTYPGELAHLLAGLRAGLHAARVGRETA